MYDICGLVVLTRKEHFSRVRHQLIKLEGVDIHQQDSCGKFAITVEEVNQTPRITDQVAAIRDFPGVVDVALAFSHSEDLSN